MCSDSGGSLGCGTTTISPYLLHPQITSSGNNQSTIWQYKSALSYSVLVLEEIEAGTSQLGNTVQNTHQVRRHYNMHKNKIDLTQELKVCKEVTLLGTWLIALALASASVGERLSNSNWGEHLVEWRTIVTHPDEIQLQYYKYFRDLPYLQTSTLMSRVINQLELGMWGHWTSHYTNSGNPTDLW